MSLSRPNTLSFSLSARHKADGALVFLSRDEVYMAIQVKLRTPKAVVCFQALSLSSFAITFSDDVKAIWDCLALEGFTSDNSVEISEIQPQYTQVDLRNIPYEMSDSSIQGYLEKYGVVLDVIRGKDKNGLFNGDRQACMSMTKILGYSAFVRYLGQGRCCRYCHHFDNLIQKCLYRVNRLCVRCSSGDASDEMVGGDLENFSLHQYSYDSLARD